MSQNLFKNILFDQISMCCWPRILAQIDPNRSFFTLVPPPCGQQYVVIRLRAGVSNCLKICSKKNTFGTTLGVLLAQDVCQNCSQSKRLHFWPPPLPATNTSRFASGEGGGKRLKICAKIRFLSKSRCVAGPGFSSKLIQIEASSLLGGLAGAPVWPEFHRSGLLGCMTAAEL